MTTRLSYNDMKQVGDVTIAGHGRVMIAEKMAKACAANIKHLVAGKPLKKVFCRRDIFA